MLMTASASVAYLAEGVVMVSMRAMALAGKVWR